MLDSMIGISSCERKSNMRKESGPFDRASARASNRHETVNPTPLCHKLQTRKEKKKKKESE